MHSNPSTTSQGPRPSDQETAYKLLIELLSHQFAFPVKWIDTQIGLLRSNKDVQRIIEIGPAKVLTTLARKTAARSVGEWDLAQAREREFLFCNDPADAKKIYFQYEQKEDMSLMSSGGIDAQPAASKIAQPEPVGATASSIHALPEKATVAVPKELAPTASPHVREVDFTSTDIILTLVSQKLRRAFDQVSLQESIRALSAGKSVLLNELIGDLGAEFGDLPESSEDLSLETLGSKLNGSNNFSGKPGSVMKKLIERFLASKLPSGFKTQAMVCEYLGGHWGLGPNRQIVVLCFCVTMEPAARLSDMTKAQEFLDSVAARYAKHVGVTLQKGQPTLPGSGVQQQKQLQQVSQANLDVLRKENTEYLQKQFQLLARHLNAGNGTASKLDHVEESEDDSTTGLPSHLDAELDDYFINGIRGIFDPRKERRYTSFWNWVREDVARLLLLQQQQENHICCSQLDVASDGKQGGHIFPSAISNQRMQSIVNRWTPALEKILRYSARAEPAPARDMAEKLLAQKPKGHDNSPLFRFSEPAVAPRTTVSEQGQIQYSEVPISRSYCETIVGHVHLRKRSGAKWEFNSQLTDAYFSALLKGSHSGFTFSGKTALITGAGPGSIGASIVGGLLSGGARVIVTTSRTPSSAAGFFRRMYKDVGARGSELILLPFNSASKKDCEQLVAYIYDENKGLNADIDFVVPFAALSESGSELDGIDAKSELAHRAMLLNVLRMLGFIKQAKEQRRYTGRPAAVVLPLSPNHGEFGGDGLYSESKIGLETLLNRFHSESWSPYLSVIGAVIGWTRGTGLMNVNNIVAQGIEDALGVLTFTPQEMAFNILALISSSMVAFSELEPVYADLSGGLQGVEGLKAKLTGIREDLNMKARVRQALTEERMRHQSALRGLEHLHPSTTDTPKPLSNISPSFPLLEPHAKMTAGLQDLAGMVDLSRTVVVVGFSELGPWGSSRTRWQMESQGQLTQDGFTEMAWIMGLIKHFDGVMDGKPYVGWVDKKTGEAVHDSDIGARYGEYIMSHSGVRIIDSSSSMDTRDQANMELFHEMVLDEALPPFEASESLAKAFKKRHGDKVSLQTTKEDSSIYTVSVEPGATFLVPTSVPSKQLVAGHLPSGWNPATYGIPEDIVSQVDPITLYVLCCVCEAMYSAGIDDPFELYKHIHVSELANCIGTGAGALTAMRNMYRERYMEKPVQSDILQETFLNSMSAWTNMLLLGATGPIKTPTGTCATAVESLDTAFEAIQSRRVKVALVGGVDDCSVETSHEFAKMKATANAADEIAKGFFPAEVSRPMSSSRAGFVESTGCGVQMVMSAELALKMGLPIYGVITHTQMAGDGVGRSLPAPGQGILTAARQSGQGQSPMLQQLNYRRDKLQECMADIESWRVNQLGSKSCDSCASSPPSSSCSSSPWLLAPANSTVQTIEAATSCQKQDAQWMWNGGNLRQLSPSMSPMGAALCVWGLTIDDVKVASFHGTSTKANDKNESRVIDQQMQHLGRTPGNPLFVVCQKNLTGHPKGAAGAWMLNGCLQILETGLVPGNRNCDDVDAALEPFHHLLYPSETVQCGHGAVKACILTSFGFGQKGGMVILVAPRVMFSAVPAVSYEKYRKLVAGRCGRINRAYQLAMMRNAVVKTKERSAWSAQGEGEVSFFLNPEARLP